MHSWLAIRRGDWRAALRAALDAADQKFAIGDFVILPVIFGEASIALSHLGAPEASAVLFGAKDRAPFWQDDWLSAFAQTEAALIDDLGADRVSSLRVRGASMPHADAVAYLRAEAARILDESPA